MKDKGQCGDNVYWTFDSETGILTIAGEGEMYDYGCCDSPFNDDSRIKSVIISDGVTNIGDWAFNCCTSLSNVTIGNSVTSIGEWAFGYCKSLTEITISNSVTSIGCYTFCFCKSLTSIIIPDSVTKISVCAFVDCASLTDVYYNGTKEKWKKIAVGSYNACLANANIHCLKE